MSRTVTPPPAVQPGPVLRDATGRLRQRRRHSWRGRLARLGAVLVVLALAATAGWVVGFSSLLASRTVVVTGARQMSQEAVLTAAAVPLGVPMARLDLPRVEQRVAALKPVASVRVERRWPHTVSIVITERTPALQVQQASQYLLVDGSGVAFAVVDGPAKGLLTARVGTADPAVLRSLAVVAAALPPGLLRRVTAVEAGSLDTIALLLDNGARIVWGSADQSTAKGQVAVALLKQRASVYDVSAPATPTTR